MFQKDVALPKQMELQNREGGAVQCGSVRADKVRPFPVCNFFFQVFSKEFFKCSPQEQCPGGKQMIKTLVMWFLVMLNLVCSLSCLVILQPRERERLSTSWREAGQIPWWGNLSLVVVVVKPDLSPGCLSWLGAQFRACWC